jgi:hypothetical protein
MGSFKSISLFESGELHCWEQSPIDLLKHNDWLSNKIIKSNLDIIFLEVNSYRNLRLRTIPSNRILELKRLILKGTNTVEDKLFIISFLGEGVTYKIGLPLIDELKTLGVHEGNIRLLYTTTDLPPKNIPHISFWEQYAKIPIVNPVNRTPPPTFTKHFLCLVRNIKKERLIFLESLSKYSWWEDRNVIDMSFGTADNPFDTINDFDPNVIKKLPIVFDMEVVSDEDQHMDLPTHMTTQLINVVVETFISNKSGIESQGYFTEKCMKPFYYNQLPIFIGQTGIVKLIRSLGFDVFDDYFEGHYYDDIDDTATRINEVTKLMDRKVNEGINLTEITNSYRDRLILNYQHLLKWDDEINKIGGNKLHSLIFEN